MPALSRTASVGYLEEKIIPAVKAVHTPAYLERLASTCVSLLEALLIAPQRPTLPAPRPGHHAELTRSSPHPFQSSRMRSAT